MLELDTKQLFKSSLEIYIFLTALFNVACLLIKLLSSLLNVKNAVVF